MVNAFGAKDLAQPVDGRVFLEPDFYRGAAHQLSAPSKKELESLGGSGYSLLHITQFLGGPSGPGSVSPGRSYGLPVFMALEVRFPRE
jgi:hypothetical protein